MNTIFPNLDKAKHFFIALFSLLPFMNFAQVIFNHSTPIYEGASNSGEVTVAVLGAIVAGDDRVIGGVVTATFNNKNVGLVKPDTLTGLYTKSGLDAGNYHITQPSGLTADIAMKALTLTAHNQEKCFNTVYNFAGTEFSLIDLVGGDEVNAATFTSAGSLICATASLTPYAIIPSLATGTDNYTITYGKGGLSAHGLPTASFTFNDASQCLTGNSFVITNTSSFGIGAV